MLELNATFFMQLALFLFSMAVLNLLVFIPLRRHLERREQVPCALADAICAREKENRDNLARLTARLDEMRADILTVKTGIRTEIDGQRDAILSQARRTAGDFLSREKEGLRRESDEARVVLAAETRSLAAVIIGRILGRGPAVTG